MANGFFPEATITLSGCGIAKPEGVHSFLGHISRIYSVAFSPDGKWALSGSRDNTVRLWDCQTGKKLRSFLGHSDCVTCVAFSPDGKWALSGSRDKTVRLWDCQTGKQIYCLTLGFGIKRVRFLPDGKRILIATNQPALQMWKLFDEQGHFRPILEWSTGSAALSAQNLSINGVKDLSESDQRLLIQHGAIEKQHNQADRSLLIEHEATDIPHNQTDQHGATGKPQNQASSSSSSRSDRKKPHCEIA